VAPVKLDRFDGRIHGASLPDTSVALAQHRGQIHRFRLVVWALGKSGASVVIFSATEKVTALEPRRDFHIA
jgi:hypothetical protein